MSNWIDQFMQRESDRRCTFCDGPENPQPDCVGCNGTGYDTEHTDAPYCPWCGAELSTDDMYEEGEYEADCPKCGREVVVELEYRPIYTTWRKEGR